MRRLKRDPLRHDAFGYLSELARELEIPIRSVATVKHLGKQIVMRVKDLARNPAYVHGHRAEAMFEMIVASLDSARLLKQEDSGRLYHSPEVEVGVPDFRLVLDDRRQVLVEVKNETEIRLHRHKKGYFERLVAYSKEMHCDLYFAVYWVGWRIWTLVRHDRFQVRDDCYEVRFEDAFAYNEMCLVGDKHFATTAPIRLRVEFQPVDVKRINARRTVQRLAVKSMNLLSESRRIDDPVERRIALAFMFYGTWVESASVETDEQGRVTAHTFEFNPRSPDEGPSPYEQNGFALIASLSGIVGGQFQARTTRAGRVIGVLPRFEAGAMKGFVPESFFEEQERALRLWSFTMLPADDRSNPNDADPKLGVPLG